MSRKALINILMVLPVLVLYGILLFLIPTLMKDLLKYILFMVFFILLPSYVFSQYLISEKLSNMKKVLYGYPVSVIVISILCWIGTWLGVKEILYLMLIISLYGLYLMVKNFKSSSAVYESKYFIKRAAIILMFIIYSVILLKYFIIPNALPTATKPGNYFIDNLWNVGNTWSVIRGFPLNDARMTGVPFGYHMLQNIYHAAIYNIFKIDPFYLLNYFEPIFLWFYLIYIVIDGGITICKFSLTRALVIAFGLLFSLPFYLGWPLQYNMIFQPISLFFGLPAFFLFIYFLTAYLNGTRKLDIFYIVILFAFISSTKVNLMLLFPITLFVMFIINILRKKYVKTELLLGLLMLAVGVVLRYSIYSQQESSIASINLYKPGSPLDIFLDKFPVLYNMRYLLFFVSKIASASLQVFSYWPFIIFVLVFIFNKAFRTKRLEKSNAIIMVYCIVSLLLVSFLNFEGGFTYFIFYPCVMLLIIGSGAIEYLFNSKIIFLSTVSILIICISVYGFIKSLDRWEIHCDTYKLNHEITFDEWQAMQWLKDNSNINAVFFEDLRIDTSNINSKIPQYFGYTAAGGRQAWVESFNPYIRSSENYLTQKRRLNQILGLLNTKDSNEIAIKLSNINADYFIQNLRFDNNDFSKVSSLKLVYSNPKIMIYQVLK